MSDQWHGGKGSRSRPLSVSQEEYSKRWDDIFKKKDTPIDNTDTTKDSYQDILSTEDCFEEK